MANLAVPENWEEASHESRVTICCGPSCRNLVSTTLAATATTTGNGFTTIWLTISPVQCAKPYAHAYAECSEGASLLVPGGGAVIRDSRIDQFALKASRRQKPPQLAASCFVVVVARFWSLVRLRALAAAMQRASRARPVFL